MVKISDPLDVVCKHAGSGCSVGLIGSSVAWSLHLYIFQASDVQEITGLSYPLSTQQGLKQREEAMD